MQFRVHTEYSLSGDGYSMAIIARGHDESRAFVQPFEMKKFEAYSHVPREEAFCLTDKFGSASVKNFLQAMMDAAWEFGLRPTGIKDQKDELAAVRYHLEDMRTLALRDNGPIEIIGR